MKRTLALGFIAALIGAMALITTPIETVAGAGFGCTADHGKRSEAQGAQDLLLAYGHSQQPLNPG